jgi:hypothetical protein
MRGGCFNADASNFPPSARRLNGAGRGDFSFFSRNAQIYLQNTGAFSSDGQRDLKITSAAFADAGDGWHAGGNF